VSDVAPEHAEPSPLLPETDGTAVGVIVAGVPATGDGVDGVDDPVVGEEVPPLEL